MTDTEEDSRKGIAPKEDAHCKQTPGHAVKNCMTVISFDGGLREDITKNLRKPAYRLSWLFRLKKNFSDKTFAWFT